MADVNTATPMNRWTDERLEQLIGNLLRSGVLLSAAVVLAGAILFLLRHGGEHPDYNAFQVEPAELRNVRGILSQAIALRARGIIQFGLLLLIATPIARVVLALVAFALQRDRMYVAVTAIVLAALLYSLVGVH